MKIFFWHQIVSPHMVDLASELSKLGHHIFYIAEKNVSQERINLGWKLITSQDFNMTFINTKEDVVNVINNSDKNSIHICEGLRANGLISYAQKQMRANKISYWIIMETVNNMGIVGILRYFIYKNLIKRNCEFISGFLAIGYKTSNWLKKIGAPDEKIFPFTYFIKKSTRKPELSQTQKYEFLFIGNFIYRKRLDLLINALSSLSKYANFDFRLSVVGCGILAEKLHCLAETKLGTRLNWVGRVSIEDIHDVISQADCLVLPSRFDGWGVVVTEALLSGTPTIVSENCGSALASKLSGFGKTFISGNQSSLELALYEMLQHGKISLQQRKILSEVAECISAESGAKYLINILEKKCFKLSDIPFLLR